MRWHLFMYSGFLAQLELAWSFSLCSLDLSLSGVAADVPLLDMALRYTSRQLLSLKQNYCLPKDVYDCCGNAGILKPKRYVHRSSGCSYVSSSSSIISVLKSWRKITRLYHTGVDLGNLISLPCLEWNSCAAGATNPLNAALFNYLLFNFLWTIRLRFCQISSWTKDWIYCFSLKLGINRMLACSSDSSRFWTLRLPAAFS